MAGGIAALGEAFPAKAGSLPAQVAALRGYVASLLENLRYLLANLDASNFSEAGIEELGELVADLVRAKTVISDTVVADELYSAYGAVASLTVDALRTDWQRAARYLAGDTSPLHYLDIHDEEISFVTAVTDGTETEQLIRDGKRFYWTDRTMSRMTCEKTTAWPVLCYRYDELVKLTICFETIMLNNGTATVAPLLVLGAGTGEGDRGKAFLFKDERGLVIRQVTGSGSFTDITLGDYVDAKHRRIASCAIDRTAGTVTLLGEGESEGTVLHMTEGEGSVRYTWPDGFVTEVTLDE